MLDAYQGVVRHSEYAKLNPHLTELTSAVSDNPFIESYNRQLLAGLNFSETMREHLTNTPLDTTFCDGSYCSLGKQFEVTAKLIKLARTQADGQGANRQVFVINHHRGFDSHGMLTDALDLPSLDINAALRDFKTEMIAQVSNASRATFHDLPQPPMTFHNLP